MSCRYRMKHKSPGFTLLELMVVAFILVLLAGVVTGLVMKRVEDAKHAKAVADIQTLGSAIDMYRLHMSEYPPDLNALITPDGESAKWNGPYVKKLENDPWDQPYAYVAPGQHNQDSYDLWTLGADGKEGGKGSDADVNNWE